MDAPRKPTVDRRLLAAGGLVILVPIVLVLGALGVLFFTLLGMFFSVGGLVIGAALVLLLVWWLWATTRRVL